MLCPLTGKISVTSHIIPQCLLNKLKSYTLGYVKKNSDNKYIEDARIFENNKQKLFSKEVENLMSVYEQLFKNYIESDQIGNKKIEERDQKKVENILQYFAEVMLLKTIFLKKPVSFSHNYRPFTEAKLKKIGNSIYKNLLLNRDKILTSNKYFLDGGLVYIHNYNKIGLKLQKFNLISHVGQYVVSDASIGFKRLKDNTTKKTVQLVILKLPLRTIIIPLDKFSQETLIENSKKYLDDAWLYKEVYKPWSLQKPERYPLISSQEPKHVQIIEKNIEAGLAKRLIC